MSKRKGSSSGKIQKSANSFRSKGNEVHIDQSGEFSSGDPLTVQIGIESANWKWASSKGRVVKKEFPTQVSYEWCNIDPMKFEFKQIEGNGIRQRAGCIKFFETMKIEINRLIECSSNIGNNSTKNVGGCEELSHNEERQ
ncbi:unnamed protein product [Linum trigynum]|uniref:Uncharacterized protein n=1 Tax=Linum trigynum TaxID=586398 RepID=A0AAV2FUR7_9ROSI